MWRAPNGSEGVLSRRQPYRSLATNLGPGTFLLQSAMTKLIVKRYHDPRQFASLVTPFLLQHEAVHCLQLGLLGAMARGDWPDHGLAAVERNGQPLLVSLHTPPHALILSLSEAPEAVERLVDELQRRDPTELPSKVLGPAPVVADFQRRWTATDGWSAQQTERQRIYQLDEVVPVAGVPGGARRATRADAELLLDWFTAFHSEAVPDEVVDVAASIERRLNSAGVGGLWLWVHGSRPVSLVGAGSPALRGARVGPVYTPPGDRRHGYASALVAHVSRHLLDSGRRFCYLFTDLNNPTSNHIYRQIGYQPVADVNKVTLHPPRGDT